MIGPISRIILRYLAGALVAYGLLDAPMGDQIASDPDILSFVSLGVGTAAGLATEVGYALAKRWGWAT